MDTGAEDVVLTALGERVRQSRVAHGWSPAELARVSGVDRAWVLRIEEGSTRQVSLLVVRRLARALHLSLDYLAQTFLEDS